ncbi:hypothetical protein HID58_071350 [Brassica napus]|uniref:Syndetin C-terminal domain-containing protein n=1 Tax=Brassica napus TaxID=3708 RepID=A0ABQ7Z1F8_BRANA|nr:hypothetical protein HID58_071350 [Brassica napus]
MINTHTATLGRSLNFTRLRLHGRIEGNVNELCAQLEKSRPIKVESGNSTRRIEDLITIRPMLLLYEEESEQEHKIWDQWRIFRSLKDVLHAVDIVSLVARILHKSKAHLQSMLMSRNGSFVEDFFGQLVGSVPDLTEHLHMTTARILRHVQNLLLEYGIEIFAETLVEGLSRIKICTDEGRALMSLDIQAYYPPGMGYVHWARAHPVVGLVTLVATMKGWKRKTRLELVDKIEAAAA